MADVNHLAIPDLPRFGGQLEVAFPLAIISGFDYLYKRAQLLILRDVYIDRVYAGDVTWERELLLGTRGSSLSL